VITLLLGALLGYLIGGIPTGVIIARLVADVDPRSVGSRHTGGTNVARAVGRAWPGVLTGLIDLGLGVLAVCGARLLWPDETWATAAAGAAAVAGHDWSPYIRLAGGVGLSTLAGMLGAQTPMFTVVLLSACILIWVALRSIIGHDARRTVLVLLMVPGLFALFGQPTHIWVSAGAGTLAALIRTLLDWRRRYAPGEGALGQFFGHSASH